MNCLDDALNTIDRVRAKSTDTAVVFCSFGKDSLVLLDLLCPRYKRVICVFMYFVKGLRHIERYISWAKSRYPNIEVVQIPHWCLSQVYRAGLYCIPDDEVKLQKLSDKDKEIRERFGCDFIYYGMKKADSLNRRLMLMQFPENEHAGKAYPLSNWTNKQVESYCSMRRIIDPVRYSHKSSGGVGFTPECFSYLRAHYPDDLERIYGEFPLSRRILTDYDKSREQD